MRKSKTLEALAERIKRERAARGMTQPELERSAGLGSGWVGHVEAGSLNGRPRAKTLKKIGDVLEVPLADLMRLAGYPEDEIPTAPAPGASFVGETPAAYLPAGRGIAPALGPEVKPATLPTFRLLPPGMMGAGESPFSVAHLLGSTCWPAELAEGATAAARYMAGAGTVHGEGDMALVRELPETKPGADPLAGVPDGADLLVRGPERWELRILRHDERGAYLEFPNPVHAAAAPDRPWRLPVGPEAIPVAVMVALVIRRVPRS